MLQIACFYCMITSVAMCTEHGLVIGRSAPTLGISSSALCCICRRIGIEGCGFHNGRD